MTAFGRKRTGSYGAGDSGKRKLVADYLMAAFDRIPDGHGLISTPRKQTFGTPIFRQLRAHLGHSGDPATFPKAD